MIHGVNKIMPTINKQKNKYLLGYMKMHDINHKRIATNNPNNV